jgi:hypothetical protein
MTPSIVAVYFSKLGTPMYAHEKVALGGVARGIAELRGCALMTEYDGRRHCAGDVYFVPDDTLLLDEALELGIQSEKDLFGGVVPRPFVKTKAITHQLVSSNADRPVGWSDAFGDKVRDMVLPGYTAFSARDARSVATRLLPLGPIRLKPSLGCGGGGQSVIANIQELESFLDGFPREELAEYGFVLEANLREVTTLSVGQVSIDNITMTYHGTQRFVKNNHGLSVYGGSDLTCIRGDWDDLDALQLTANIRRAAAQARGYDKAMIDYRGFMASRRNYDVGQGIDMIGRWRSGVFEASWRSGGASTAEIAALTAFARDPDLQIVRASAVKEFGAANEPPPGATIHFHGEDPRDGPILRYTVTRAVDRGK